MVPRHQPGIGVVLEQPEGLALHHLEIHAGLEYHPHQGGIGQNLYHPVRYLPIIALPQHLRPEARPVHAVDFPDTILYIRIAVHGAVHRQVPALGVAAHIERAAESPGHPVQIFHAYGLSRHRREERHIEVLLPPYDGLVRAPVRHIAAPVPQGKSHRRELGLPPLLYYIYIIIQLQVPEALPLNHPLVEGAVWLLIAHVRKELLKIRMLLQALQRDTRPLRRLHQKSLRDFRFGLICRFPFRPHRFGCPRFGCLHFGCRCSTCLRFARLRSRCLHFGRLHSGCPHFGRLRSRCLHSGRCCSRWLRFARLRSRYLHFARPRSGCLHFERPRSGCLHFKRPHSGCLHFKHPLSGCLRFAHLRSRYLHFAHPRSRCLHFERTLSRCPHFRCPHSGM